MAGKNIQSVIEKLFMKSRRKYQNEGFSSLISTAPSYSLRKLAEHNYSILDRDRSIERAKKSGSYIKIETSKDCATISNKLNIVNENKEISPLYSGTHQSAQPFVYSLNDTYLFGDKAIGFTPDGKLAIDTARNSIKKTSLRGDIKELAKLNTFLMGKTPPHENFNGEFFYLVWPYGYYHWIHEYLIKLPYLKCYEEKTGKSPKILIRENPPGWMVESLEFFGYDEDRLHEWGGTFARFESLILSPHRLKKTRAGDRFDSSLTEYQMIRQMLLQNSEKSRETPSRVYISREDAGKRNVVNKEEVYSTLYDYGFEIYNLSEFDFEEQVRIFMNADIVLGPHGAGLGNILFSMDVDVIELLPKSGPSPHFFYLAEQLNFRYHAILCESEGSLKKPKDQDIYVDINDLEKTIKIVLANRS